MFLGTGGIARVPAAAEFVFTGASIGVVLLLLLTLGLEFSLGEFAVSLSVGICRQPGSTCCSMPFRGRSQAGFSGFNAVGILAMAGITYISSSGIIARLLSGIWDRLGNRETPAVLSVLVLEDFAMAAYLPLLTVLASGGNLAAGARSGWRWHLARSRWRSWCPTAGVSRSAGILAHPEDEQLLLRILGLTLIVAAVAEHLHASAAVGGIPWWGLTLDWN